MLAYCSVYTKCTYYVHQAIGGKSEYRVWSVDGPSEALFFLNLFEQNIFLRIVEIRHFQSGQVLGERRSMGLDLSEILKGSNVVFGAGLEADVAEIWSIWDQCAEYVTEHGTVGLTVLDLGGSACPRDVEDVGYIC